MFHQLPECGELASEDFVGGPHDQVQSAVELAEHRTDGQSGAGSVALWLDDRLNGVPAPAGCHNRDVYSQILDPGAFDAFVGALGRTLASALGMPV
ncbi:hypothetical protein [Nocardia fluminea]|uniref:hypothetical protein n=1 Tax=Nocardia fluminea TaxID=134984 RepID=UPI003D1514A7